MLSKVRPLSRLVCSSMRRKLNVEKYEKTIEEREKTITEKDAELDRQIEEFKGKSNNDSDHESLLDNCNEHKRNLDSQVSEKESRIQILLAEIHKWELGTHPKSGSLHGFSRFNLTIFFPILLFLMFLVVAVLLACNI